MKEALNQSTSLLNQTKKSKKKMWDETVAGPKPEHGLGRLRNKITAQPIDIKGITHIFLSTQLMHIYFW